MMGFTSKKYPSECRLEASNFIQLLCHTSVLTLQMFISYVNTPQYQSVVRSQLTQMSWLEDPCRAPRRRLLRAIRTCRPRAQRYRERLRAAKSNDEERFLSHVHPGRPFGPFIISVAERYGWSRGARSGHEPENHPNPPRLLSSLAV